MRNSRLFLLITRINNLLLKGGNLTMLDMSKLFTDFSVELNELNGSLKRPTLFKFYLTFLIDYFKMLNDPFRIPLLPDRLPQPLELGNIVNIPTWLLLRLLLKLLVILIRKLLKKRFL